MCLQTFKEWVDVLESLAVGIAAAVAVYGISSWRREYVGKRQIELAEQVLAMFYEAQDAVRAIRSPFGYTNEGKTREPEAGETAQQKESRDRAFVTIERTKQFVPLFARIRSARYQFMAVFGAAAGEPFRELNQLINELHYAANDYADHMDRAQYLCADDEGAVREHQEESTRLRRILHEFPARPGKPDEFGKRLTDLIEAIEKICRPSITSGTKRLIKD